MKLTRIVILSLFLITGLTQFAFAQGDPDAYLESKSFKFFKDANELFLQQKFSEAAVLYQKSFDLEKDSTRLPKKFWYLLVDNLGMSYGIPGELNKAEDIFLYGISKEPKYPMFYYNLACVYAERDKLEKAIECLTKAIKFKDNILATEEFPDPSQDDSFKKFLKEEKFIKLLQDNNYLPVVKDLDSLWQEYSNDQYNYSISFPKSWIVSVPKEQYHVVRCEYLSSDTARLASEGALRVMVQIKKDDVSLEDVIKTNMRVVNIVGKDIYINKIEKATLNGIECILHDYTFNYKNKSIPQRQRTIAYYFISDGKIYNFYFMGETAFYNKNMEMIKKSLNSFKLLKQ
jgi:tetratricopeptide (TPR) repeat protein